MSVTRPSGMMLLGACKRAQCARMLYDQTAGRFVDLRELFGGADDGDLCSSSARLGSHAGQAIGRFVEGFVWSDFESVLAWNLTPRSGSYMPALGAYVEQMTRGWSVLVLTRKVPRAVRRGTETQRTHLGIRHGACGRCVTKRATGRSPRS
jgi:hypothetical protein